MQSAHRRTKAEQAGFVSIVVAALIMIILSLITVGFTRLMQREQRQAIDRQLSRTALYAAESGVNDVLARIADPAADPVYDLPSKSTCDVSGLPNSGVLSADGTVAYTCALYDQNPGALDYDLDTDDSKIAQLTTASGDPFASLQIAWGHQTGDNFIDPLPDCTNPFVHPASRNSAVPVLRVDLTSANGPYTRDNLLRDTDYMFLVPCDGVGAANHPFNISDRGNAVAVPCDVTSTAPEPCVVDITDINLAASSNTLFARIRPVYAPARMSISGLDTFGNPVQFDGAQVGVDVTAKANDVVRRIRVSVPLRTEVEVPEAAIQAFEGLCKRLDVINETAGSVNIVDECVAPVVPPPTMAVCDLTAVGPGIPPYPRIVPDILAADFDPSIHGVWGSAACSPPPAGCGLNGSYNLSALAASLPGSTYQERLRVLDTIHDYDPDPSDPTSRIPGPRHAPITTPHVPLDALGLVLTDGCNYEIGYEMFCAFVDPAVAPPLPAPPNNCTGATGAGAADPIAPMTWDQPAEAMRVEFFGSYSGSGATLTCTGPMMAFIFTEDRSDADSDGYIDTTGWSDTVPLQRVAGQSGSVQCMRLQHRCDADPTYMVAYCNALNTFSSVHLEEVQWTVVP